jgi:hypothetical protein
MKTLFDPVSYRRDNILWKEIIRDSTHVTYRFVTDDGYRSKNQRCLISEWERHIAQSEPSDEDIV